MLIRILSAILLLVLLPFLLIIFIFIYIEDGYPFIFQQFRIGQHERVFVFYKIRTMRKDTPEKSTKEIDKSESYLLKTGYYLRKYSIDESLNLLNIMKGDMKFIGPRPLIIGEVHMHARRKELGITKQKPGITGWAQINGRDEISDDRKLELEKYYLDNQSIKLRFVIVLKTIYYVFSSVRQKLFK